jgi:hypothetical protein
MSASNHVRFLLGVLTFGFACTACDSSNTLGEHFSQPAAKTELGQARELEARPDDNGNLRATFTCPAGKPVVQFNGQQVIITCDVSKGR